MADIRVLVEMGVPDGDNKSPNQGKTIESEVREAIECIESGFDSHVEWLFLNKTYKALKEIKRPSERAQNIIEMIEPVLSKYGYHGVSSEDQNGR